jgi:hypothetical protein
MNRGAWRGHVCAKGQQRQKGFNPNGSRCKGDVRVAQSQVRRESTHVAQPTIPMESSRSLGGRATATDGRKVREVELVPRRGRFGLGPAQAR